MLSDTCLFCEQIFSIFLPQLSAPEGRALCAKQSAAGLTTRRYISLSNLRDSEM